MYLYLCLILPIYLYILCVIKEDHFQIRLKAYEMRKKNLIRQYQQDLALASNRHRFITEFRAGNLKISPNGKSGMIFTEKDILDELVKKEYQTISFINNIGGPVYKINQLTRTNDIIDITSSTSVSSENTMIEMESGEINEQEESIVKYKRQEFSYLLDMAIYSLTKERVTSLEKDVEKVSLKLKSLQETSEIDLWLEDLDLLESKLPSLDLP